MHYNDISETISSNFKLLLFHHKQLQNFGFVIFNNLELYKAPN
jgi:hypothetical protein